MAVKVVVVGDFLAVLSLHVEKLPRPYQTAAGHGFHVTGGGRGIVQAVTAARLGADVTFVGRVGKDINADFARELLQQENIKDCLSVDPTHPTGVKLSFAETTERTMSGMTNGANTYLSTADIETAEEAIKAADVLVTQLAVPLPAVRHALELAQQHKVCSVLKPTPFTPVQPDMLALPNYVTPNQEELRELATHTREIQAPAEQITICTLGSQGAHWFQKTVGGQMLTGRVDAFKVKAVDVTGAGDVFSAALGVALAEGKALLEAMRFANAAAALSTTKTGEVNSVPVRAAVDALL